LNKEEQITISVYDEDTVTDDFIGNSVMFLDEIKKKGKFNDWIKLQYKGKEAGQIKYHFFIINFPL
jgi:Ca2+-dependent lipid-binding protein